MDKLFGALAAAQSKIGAAAKDKTNPHFQSKYADLSSIWEACRGALSEQGIAVVQMPGYADGMVTVKTVLCHSSGQSIEGSLSLPVSGGKMGVTAQTIGSAITYARRYALAAMVGVTPEDDDGNAASSSAPPSRQNAPVRRDPPPRAQAEPSLDPRDPPTDDGPVRDIEPLVQSVKRKIELLGEETTKVCALSIGIQGRIGIAVSDAKLTRNFKLLSEFREALKGKLMEDHFKTFKGTLEAWLSEKEIDYFKAEDLPESMKSWFREFQKDLVGPFLAEEDGYFTVIPF